MKAITHEWLTKAAEDLAAAQALLAHPDLTNIVAFHAQQAVEKVLKAAIEELGLGPIKTHSLTRLYALGSIALRGDHRSGHARSPGSRIH